jgi:hypothetical protein
MPGVVRTSSFVDPEHLVRLQARLIGKRRSVAIGSLPTVPWDPKAAPALRGFYDLRAIALRFLDAEFVAAIRPVHTEPACMFDAGIDAIGYAAFALSEYRQYLGIQNNLAALHHYLIGTPDLIIEQYDLSAFLIVLSAAREAIPELAALTSALAPLLKEERIFQLSRRMPSEYSKLLRRLYNNRADLAALFRKLDGHSPGQNNLGDVNIEWNEVVAALFPLLQQEPDELRLGYQGLADRIRSTSGGAEGEYKAVADQPVAKKRKQPASRHKYVMRTDLGYYRPAADAITDHVTRPDQFVAYPKVPDTIKAEYARCAREHAKAQKIWDGYARETWAAKSTMRWQIVEEGGSRPVNLERIIMDPLGRPMEMKLIEEALEERKTEAAFMINLSASMQENDRYKLGFMLADRFSELLTRGDISSEIIGHTTIGKDIRGVVGRNRAMLYLIFKERNEPYSIHTRQRLCCLLDTAMHRQSYDGEALLAVYKRLLKSRAQHKLLFVGTDGGFSGMYMNRRGNPDRYITADYFRDVVALIEREKKVELVGVPLMADVDGIFKRSVRLDSMADIYTKLSPYILDLLRSFNRGEGEAARDRQARMVEHRRARISDQRVKQPAAPAV